MASDALFVAGNVLAMQGNFTGEAGGVSHRRNYIYRDAAGSLVNPFHNYVSVRYTAISQLPSLDRAKLAAAGTEYPEDNHVHLSAASAGTRCADSEPWRRLRRQRGKNSVRQSRGSGNFLENEIRLHAAAHGKSGKRPAGTLSFRNSRGPLRIFCFVDDGDAAHAGHSCARSERVSCRANSTNWAAITLCAPATRTVGWKRTFPAAAGSFLIRRPMRLR